MVLLFFAIFLFLTLLSHDPRDPSLSHYVPHPHGVRNWGGIVGAVASDLLLQLLGLMAFPTVALLAAIGGLILGRVRISFIPLRIIGLMVAFGAAAALLHLGGMDGGLMGRALAGLISGYFNRGGSLTLCIFALAGAFVMVTGLSISQLLFKGAFLAVKGGTLGLMRGVRLLGTRRRRGKGKEASKKRAMGKPAIVPAEPSVKEGRIKQEELPFPKPVEGGWRLPPLTLLEGGKRERVSLSEDTLWATSQLLENKLRDFGVEGKVVEVRPGPVVTVYEFEPAPGVKISRIVNLEDDLALALSAHSVRIEAPIPGKSVVGIEVSNPVRETVYLKEVISSDAFQSSPSKLTLALGKDILGKPFVVDLAKLPHLLVAGSTGSGKSVSMNCMITSILFRATPDEVKFLLIDPKMLELSSYEDIPHLLLPVVTDPREAAAALRWVVREMEERYSMMAAKGTKHIERYNRRVKEHRDEEAKPLPYIVVMIDELADLMIVSRREVEESITRLAQMARAAGIHLVLATQRPSVDVITGLIKVNFPARISFQVSTKVDSRTVLDTTGAEHLLGSGDMLFMPPGSSRLKRVHGAYIREDEIKQVAEFWRSQGKPEYNLDILKETPSKAASREEDDYDEKYDEAVAFVMETGQASVSLLQRRFKIGYNRAARLIERMEREGIVGPSDGVKPREVLIRKR